MIKTCYTVYATALSSGKPCITYCITLPIITSSKPHVSQKGKINLESTAESKKISAFTCSTFSKSFALVNFEYSDNFQQ